MYKVARLWLTCAPYLKKSVKKINKIKNWRLTFFINVCPQIKKREKNNNTNIDNLLSQSVFVVQHESFHFLPSFVFPTTTCNLICIKHLIVFKIPIVWVKHYFVSKKTLYRLSTRDLSALHKTHLSLFLLFTLSIYCILNI